MPDPGPRRRGSTVRRLPIVAAVAIALVVGGLIDRTGSAATPKPAAAIAAEPVAAPANALSSSWFCAGATDTAQGAAPGTVVIANHNPTTVNGQVKLIGSNGRSALAAFTVDPFSRRLVKEVVAGGAPWIGAMVQVDAGGVGVAQEIDSHLGVTATPCATTGSNQWYFTSGATRINQSVELALLNPYPTDAVVDLTFSTDQGIEQPGDFQGLDVPARGITVVDVNSHLRRRQAIATAVSARTGRVVAWETAVTTAPPNGAPIVGTPAAAAADADPAAPVAGMTVTLGTPSLGTQWTWPDGIVGDGVDEQYVIYNPGDTTAQVQLALQLAQGSAEPFQLTVGAEQVVTVDSGQQARIPASVAHSAELTSTNGVPVVAERTLIASSPSNRTGRGALLGGRSAAAVWLLAPGSPGPSQDEYITVYNPGRSQVTVAIDALSGGRQAPLPGLAALTVASGGRMAVRINDHATSFKGALVVSASAAVYVEQDLYGSGRSPGVSLSLGIPLP